MKLLFSLILNFLVTGASLPVKYKGGWISRVLIHFFEKWKKDIPDGLKTHSNYGIHNRLRIEMPLAGSPAHLLYGSPKNYVGEYHTLLLTRVLMDQSDVFVDVGANWGYYSFFIASGNELKKPAYAFEPNPFLFDYLKKNTRLNEWAGFQVIDLAVCDISGSISFYQDRSSDLTSTINSPEHKENFMEIKVPCTRLDDWAGSMHLNNMLVKVDVENAEWNFIKGTTGIPDKIKYLVMEVLGPARQSGFIEYMVNKLNWKAYYINQEKIEWVRADDMRYTPGEYNWLFCREDPSSLRQILEHTIFKVVS